jgi:hypothetical protein
MSHFWLLLLLCTGPTVQAFVPRGLSRAQPPKATSLNAVYSNGLSTPAGRILDEVVSVSKGKGYYRARQDERVIDVVFQITEGNSGDIALVYADDKDQDVGSALLGIFTETDYINVRR